MEFLRSGSWHSPIRETSAAGSSGTLGNGSRRVSLGATLLLLGELNVLFGERVEPFPCAVTGAVKRQDCVDHGLARLAALDRSLDRLPETGDVVAEVPNVQRVPDLPVAWHER